MGRLLALLGLLLALGAPAAAMPAQRLAALSPNVCANVTLKTDFAANGRAGAYCLNGQRFASFKEMPGANFTRASTKTCTTSAGVIVSAASGQPCITDQGILIEESRTNLVFPSADLSGLPWGLNSATAVANAVLAPDGTMTAAQLTATGAGGSASTPFSVTNGVTYTTSAYYRYISGGTTMRFVVAGQNAFGGTGGDRRVIFNGQTCSFISKSTEVSAFSLTPMANGWCRVAGTWASSSSSAAVSMAVYSDVSSVFAGWGADLEVGGFASSYIPTTGTAATRAADVASITVSTVSPTGALIVNGLWDHVASQIEGVAAISDGTGLNQIGFFRTAAVAVQGRYVVANTDTSPGVNTGAGTSGRRRMAITWSPSRVMSASGGALSTPGTPSGTPVTTAVYIGLTSAGASPANGIISSLALMPQMLTDAQAQDVTQ